MEMDKEGKNLFLLGSNSLQKMDMGSEKLTPIHYQANLKMDMVEHILTFGGQVHF